MERCSIVCATGAQGDKVLGGLGHCFAEELDLKVTLSRVELKDMD